MTPQMNLQNGSTENLQFGALCDILEPNPTIHYPIWLHHIDRHEKAVLFYQLDLHSMPPSVRKTLQIRSRIIPLASGPRTVLIPVAHVDTVEIPREIIKDKIGRSFIGNAADVQTVLDFLHNSTSEDIVQNGENLENVRAATVSRAAPKTSRKRPISPESDRDSDSDGEDQRLQLPASDYLTLASRGSKASRPSVITRGQSASSEATTSSARKSGKRRPRLTMPKKKPRARPKTTHEIRVTASSSLASHRATKNGSGQPEAQSNGETESHGLTSSKDQPTRSSTNFADGDTVESKLLNQDLIMPLVVKYREIICNELGIPVEGDIPQPLDLNVVVKARKLIMDVCELKPEQESSWKSNAGGAIRFGLRSSLVWREFMLMFKKFESHKKLDQIRMYHLRDILNRISDDEAIRFMRECTEQLSGEPFRRAARLGFQSVTGVYIGPKSGSSSITRDTEDESMG